MVRKVHGFTQIMDIVNAMSALLLHLIREHQPPDKKHRMLQNALGFFDCWTQTIGRSGEGIRTQELCNMWLSLNSPLALRFNRDFAFFGPRPYDFSSLQATLG